MGLSEWHNDDLPPRKEPLNPARIIVAVLFGLFAAAVVVGCLYLVVTSPLKVEIHEREGQMYRCTFYRDGDIRCVNEADSDIGGGQVIP